MLFRMTLRRAFNLEICCIFLLLCIESLFCFNLDTATPIVHSGPENSYFGFSLSGYGGLNSNWLIIGAPKAQTNQSGVTEGGSVFKCNPSQSNDCTRLILDRDRDGNEIGNIYKTYPGSDSEMYQFSDKSFQMFGATIESSRVKGGPLLACAPRYVWYNIHQVHLTPQYPVGRCFAALDDLQSVKSYTPCLVETGEPWKRSLAGFVYGHAGISAAIPKETDSRSDFLLGAVGTRNFQGGVIKLDFNSNYEQFSAKIGNDIFNYKGYSSGYITMNNVVRYVTGAPRASQLLGAVYVLPNAIDEVYVLPNAIDGDSLIEFNGDQFGAYFGQSLTVLDLNRDGLEDLVVGAPWYVNHDKWECGRIYIYYQDRRIEFKEPVKITGHRIRSRFGYSLAALGDINADGYDDLGVGAPHDGEDGSGVVYIYQGHVDGINVEASQAISPSDLNLNLTTFGAALSGGIDVDDNAYPDMLVGAYGSDKAILLRSNKLPMENAFQHKNAYRSRPVINVVATVQPEPKGINLEQKNLQLPGETTMVTSYLVNGCLRYSGTSVPTQQEFIVTITLDQNQPPQTRTVFLENGNSELQRSVTLNAGAESDICINEKAYIQDEVADKFNPIIITMTFTPVEQTDVDLLPILNQHSVSASSQAYFLNSCENNICIPDLSLEAKSLMSTVTIGDKKGLAINVTVENKGDMAFSSVLKADLPHGLGLIGTRRSDSTDIFIDCDFDENKLECDIGNPLPAKKKINILVYLSVDDLEGDDETLSFVLTVDSLNQENETTLNDNNVNINVKVEVSATIELKGISIPEQVTFYEDFPKDDRDIKSADDIGPVVSHTYEVLNHGPSRVGVTEVEITWPMKTTNGNYLFYLTEVSTNKKGDICSVSGGVDPNNLTMIQAQPTYNGANRLTRDVVVDAPEMQVVPSATPNVNALSDCLKGSGCVNITCRVNMIVGRASLIITLKSRLWVNTLIKNNIKETFATSSASSRVLSMPYLIAPDVERRDSLEITTDVNPATPSVDVGTVEIWIIILAIIGGLLLLLLLAAGLYKCGFFKRKTIPTEESNGSATEAGDGAKNGAFE